MASKGHVVDLPKSGLSIDVDHDFKPEYVVTNPKSLSELKRAFKSADKLIIASDLDREGEAIGWHIAKELKVIDDKGHVKGKRPLERIVFHEITKDAIQEALNNPRAIDINLVNSQQARRLLDRIVGYKLSPLLWKKIAFGLSAGRVQSVAVRLIVEKEDERNKFNKEEYWTILANLSKKEQKEISVTYQKLDKDQMVENEEEEPTAKDDLIPFELSKINSKSADLKEESDAKEVVSGTKDKKWVISDIVTTQTKRNTKPPFITSTLQQTGVNWLGFTAKRTMIAAQKLYEAGFITYMRTDSVVMSNIAIEQAKDFIVKNFGDKYYPEKPNFYKSSNKSAQEAHECIRPSNFFDTSTKLGLEGDMKRVYDLIWQRALASQMTNALIESSALVINIDKYEFRSNGKRVLFDGFLKVYPEKVSENMLPNVAKGVELYPAEIISSQHFTQPPARYSEATLIKKLEELGIGRPSTYASIISTILARKYVEVENKYLRPTDTGIVVTRLLEKYFSNIVDYGFTADMEKNLDIIAEGKLDWVKMLSDFYFPFDKKLIKEDKNIPRSEFTELGKSDEKCPECGKPMVIKLGRYGRFLSCSDFPTCKGMLSINDESDNASHIDLAEVAKSQEFTDKYEGAPKTDDGRDFILKEGKFGRFWAHPDYPKVKDARPLLLHAKCPESGHHLVERKGKWGKTFIGCSAYPNCKYIQGAKTKDVKGKAKGKASKAKKN